MNILQRIKDGASRVSEKAQSSVEIGKLNGHISDIEREMELEFMKMGKLFYDGYRARDLSVAEGKMVELSKLCLKHQEQIDELRFKIAELKNERLCVCGNVVALDANFCPKCGHRLEAPAPKKEAPAVTIRTIHDDEEDQYYGEDELTEEEKELALRTEQRTEHRAVYTEVLHDDEELEAGGYAGQTHDSERGRREADELERERERQLELDRRIRDWKAGEHSEEAAAVSEGTVRDIVKCQICRADLPKGSMWCPRCGSEQI
ncbi:zinc ribbon domain-containing protein [Paenibacillus pedocola]|uniref:zinc ribbon domain-containing protein n=1 Tax=Paenibacillus pedocola TaxID=3242193 RepID=UPI002877F771|nr:zinc ribbon domain-containing protein [Paenibacillus typhae]